MISEERDVLKREINESPDEFFERDKSGKGYVCELCGSGLGKHGTGLSAKRMIDGRIILTCWNCGESGDVVHWLELTKHMSYNEVLEYGSEILNKNNLSVFSSYKQSKEEIDFRKFFEEAAENLMKTNYWIKRGLSLETCRYFNLGYVAKWKHPKVSEYVKTTPRLIVPISENGYLARDVRKKIPKNELEYVKSKVGKQQLFHLEALKNEIVWVVEGEFDAMSMYEIGVETVALGSVSCKNKLVETIKNAVVKPKAMIIALDNDEAGKNASEILQNALQGVVNIVLVVRPYGEYKDASETLVADREFLKKSVTEIHQKLIRQIELKKQDIKSSSYLRFGQMLQDTDKFQKYINHKTGYANIDRRLNLYPGLYVLGAVPGLGKTTFMTQMANQIEAQGEEVIFFSYEQSRFELISKGISRLTYQQSDGMDGVSSLQIRRGASGASVRQAIETYEKLGENEIIYEAEFEDTVDTICSYLETKIKESGKNPIVFVDYLQVIAPTKDKNGRQLNTKENIDNIVKRLKSLQREYGLVMFLISSLNRQNYIAQIDFESFKESGGIEYTADVVWGMQLMAMKKIKDLSTLDEKRECLKKAKIENPRKIELVCLKNRYGAPGYSCYFKYYPAYDYFEASTERELKSPQMQPTLNMTEESNDDVYRA